MQKKALISIVLMVLISFTAAPPALGAAYPLELKDATGAFVTIKAEPARIVSIVPSITEMLYAVGLGDKIVGVTAWCTFPEAAKKVDKIGDMNINIEAVLAKRPDLVVADMSMSGSTVAKLRELGLTVLAVNARNLDEMMEALLILGRAGGREEAARKLADSLRARVLKVKDAVSRASTKPSVFVEIWNEPLMTAGNDTYVHELIVLAGGRNIAESVSGWPVFSTEMVISQNPHIILLTNFNKAEVMARKAWAGLSAVLLGRVVEVDPDILVRSGPRLVDGLEELARLLHPELWK
jgi:iron complex transport system substrate-binding protein